MEACAGSLIHPHRAQSERGSLCPGGGRHCGGLSGPIAAREANRTPSGCDAGTPACPRALTPPGSRGSEEAEVDR